VVEAVVRDIAPARRLGGRVFALHQIGFAIAVQVREHPGCHALDIIMRVHARVPARLDPRHPGVGEEEVRGRPRGARHEHLERGPLARSAGAQVVEEDIGDAIIIVVQHAERPFPRAWAEPGRARPCPQPALASERSDSSSLLTFAVRPQQRAELEWREHGAAAPRERVAAARHPASERNAARDGDDRGVDIGRGIERSGHSRRLGGGHGTEQEHSFVGAHTGRSAVLIIGSKARAPSTRAAALSRSARRRSRRRADP
jgi:hypothetical protein